MSAIQSLLRVMTLRDADALVLETGKVPSLMRRGQLESLALPPLEAALLTEFVAPLGAERVSDAWPAIVPFDAPGGGRYQCTIEKVPAGLRIVVRLVAPAQPAQRPWAQAQVDARPPIPVSRRVPAPEPASVAPAPVASSAAPAPVIAAPAAAAAPAATSAESALAQLAHLLEGSVAIARERGASDVLLSTGRPPHIRLDGRIEALELAIDDAALAACVAALGSNSDHGLEIAGARVRVNAFDHLTGVGVAARLIRDRVPSLAQLGLPAELTAATEHRDGLVLVCGPTGSGKSTTLAALVELIDHKRAAHVITIEDPIEYRFAGRRSIVHQREVGQHVPSFATGLRAALREAPDVIVLGELRDTETIAAALTAAETGHLVLATLHAPGAAGAIDRVIDAFPAAQQRQIRWQLAGALRAVITQYLLPKRTGGRAVATEVVPITAGVASMIRRGELHTLPSAIQAGRDAGMIPLERSLARLVESGAVSAQVVKRIAADHDLLASLTDALR